MYHEVGYRPPIQAATWCAFCSYEPPNEVKDDSCFPFLENVQDLLTLSSHFPTNNIFFTISLYRPSSVIWLFSLVYDCAVIELPVSYICIRHILLQFTTASYQTRISFLNGGNTKTVFTGLKLFHMENRLGSPNGHKRVPEASSHAFYNLNSSFLIGWMG